MASKQAHKRLMKELADLEKAPPPFILARPKENDILEWSVFAGPSSGGQKVLSCFLSIQALHHSRATRHSVRRRRV